MIEVTIRYYKKTYKSGRERFIYKDLVVKGHASDGSLTSTKCCAGVTAVTCGIIHIFDEKQVNIVINKGLFCLNVYANYETEVADYIEVLVYQLTNIATIYPQFFKDFNFIEEKN